jgi:hypothetical protein
LKALTAGCEDMGRGERQADLLRVLAEPRRNERILAPGAAVAPRVPLPPLDDHAGPAPFSLGQHSRIATVLRAASLSDVAIAHRG